MRCVNLQGTLKQYVPFYFLARYKITRITHKKLQQVSHNL